MQNANKGLYRLQNLYHHALTVYLLPILQSEDELKLKEVAEQLHGVANALTTTTPTLQNKKALELKSTVMVTQLIILIDKKGIITDYNLETSLLLQNEDSELMGCDLQSILHQQSIPVWKKMAKQMKASEIYQSTGFILFTSKKNHWIPAFCAMSNLTGSNQWMVTSVVGYLIVNNSKNTSKKGFSKQEKTAITLIQKVYEYILAHLEEPLPSTHTLANLFNTNEYKLKEGFRNLLNTSVYQLYTNERLKKALLLIENTNIPLKEIAFTSGFSEYTNFSKAFKKKYGIAPSEIIRKVD